MRLQRLLPISFLLACGDDTGVKPDAGPRPDAATTDAATDGSVDPDGSVTPDAPPDAPPMATGTRIYAVGDIVTNNVTVAVGFEDTTPLPVDTAAPPIKIPAVGTELFDGAGSTSQVFDAKAGKVAYVADSTVAGRYDLYAANADGSSPVLLVEGTVIGVEITAVSLSPDGTKVAFLMDSVLVNGGYDLYMVATTNPQTPVQLSPARPVGAAMQADMDVFATVTWSNDSKLIGYSGDLVESLYDQAWVVDTTAANPASVSLLNRDEIAMQMMGARGVRGALQFDAANNIYFRARVDAGSTQFKLFKATAAGAATRVALTMPARGDASVPDVGAFGIAPNGTKIVFSADAPTAGAYNLYVSDVTTFAPMALTAVAGGNANFTSPIWFSPDGTKIAVVADFLTSTLASPRNEPFVIALDGSTQQPRRLAKVDGICVGTCDAMVMQWAADNRTVYIMGDLLTANDIEIYRADSTMADQPLTVAVDLVTDGDAINLIARPK